nr:Integrase, catalytic core [Ipomoea batatas]
MNFLDTNEHQPEVFEPADDLIQLQGKPIRSGQVEKPTVEPDLGEKRTTPRVISKAISYDNLSQSKDTGDKLEDATQFRRFVGKFLYLTSTRLDISYATQQPNYLSSENAY